MRSLHESDRSSLHHLSPAATTWQTEKKFAWDGPISLVHRLARGIGRHFIAPGRGGPGIDYSRQLNLSPRSLLQDDRLRNVGSFLILKNKSQCGSFKYQGQLFLTVFDEIEKASI